MSSEQVDELIKTAIVHFSQPSTWNRNFSIFGNLTMAQAKKVILEVYDNCSRGGWGITLHITRSGLMYLHPNS